jgi:inosine/xanthosine triphosphatase
MRINIGSLNPVKVEAVKDTIKQYGFFKDAKIVPIESESEVSGQPKSLNETITGAKNRAKNCFQNCDYSIGIESGLIETNEPRTKHMNFCVCAIYNGKKFALGFSPAFPLPKIFSDSIAIGKEVDAVAYETKQTDNPGIKKESGIIGIWTKGIVTRKDYTIPAIQMALIELQNPELFDFN